MNNTFQEFSNIPGSMLTVPPQLTCTPELSEHLVLTLVTLATVVTVELVSVQHLVTRHRSSVRELCLTAGVLALLIQVTNTVIIDIFFDSHFLLCFQIVLAMVCAVLTVVLTHV